jgi:hypothetical protein
MAGILLCTGFSLQTGTAESIYTVRSTGRERVQVQFSKRKFMTLHENIK